MKPPEGANAPRKTTKPAKPAKRPKGAEAVDLGDQVYVRHPKRGAVAVRVSAVGKDGFTGRCDANERHKCQWQDYLGHKAKMLHRYELIEQGADGALVRDSAGRQRFLAGIEMPEPAETEARLNHEAHDDPIVDGLDKLTKALDGPTTTEGSHMLPTIPDGTRVLLLKAACSDDTPPRKPADKGQGDFGQGDASPAAGGKAKGGKAPMQHGDTVGFRHGDVAGSGKIVASGQDGVTVQDENGQAHQVRHEHLTGPQAPQQPAQDENNDGVDDQAEPAAADGTPVSPQMDQVVKKAGQAMRALMIFFQPKQGAGGDQA